MITRTAQFSAFALRRGCAKKFKTSPWSCLSWQTRNFSLEITSPGTSDKPYYITTPIFYVNAAPHVGHLYSMVLADVVKRWHMLKGESALLCTGTDEHGLKVQRAAAKAVMEPKLFCDKGAEIFRELARKAEIANEHFIRTTDREHKSAVEYAWSLLQEKGLVYEQKHMGWYSVTDECFYPESAVQLYLDPVTGRKLMTSIETGSEVEWASEQNYHFRLSMFRSKLLQFYEENPEWITPAHRMKEVVDAVKAGLEDLSVSRPYDRLNWGIRVPEDETQTIYVWIDALMSYATKSGYPWTPGREHAGGWPADCHIIGKDIVRFHCIYWPAFLMALGLQLPKKILAHGHWTLGNHKMSKSTGRVVDPFHAIDRFGPDVMRFFLASKGGIEQDAKYDNLSIIKVYEKFLNSQLGNLASRVTRGKRWSVRGAVQRAGKRPEGHWDDGPGSNFLKTSLSTIASRVERAFESYQPREALFMIEDFVRGSNAFFQMSKPWDKILGFAPDEPGDDVDDIIYLASEALRITGILLLPAMPNKAGLLLDQLGISHERRMLQYCKPGADPDYGTPMVDLGSQQHGVLFPRIPAA